MLKLHHPWKSQQPAAFFSMCLYSMCHGQPELKYQKTKTTCLAHCQKARFGSNWLNKAQHGSGWPCLEMLILHHPWKSQRPTVFFRISVKYVSELQGLNYHWPHRKTLVWRTVKNPAKQIPLYLRSSAMHQFSIECCWLAALYNFSIFTVAYLSQ